MQKTIRTLDNDESHKLLEFLQTYRGEYALPKYRARNYCMALLMLDAGLRVSEVVQLVIVDLYFANNPVNELYVREEIAKGHRVRSVPTTNRLRLAITQMYDLWWRHSFDDQQYYGFYVVRPGRPITPRQVQRIISDAGRRSIDRIITPHMLRHTFATNLMRKTNIRVVQQLLGHKSLTSTQVYTHPNSEDLRKAIDSLPS